jgi:hypothetical protein
MKLLRQVHNALILVVLIVVVVGLGQLVATVGGDDHIFLEDQLAELSARRDALEQQISAVSPDLEPRLVHYTMTETPVADATASYLQRARSALELAGGSIARTEARTAVIGSEQNKITITIEAQLSEMSLLRFLADVEGSDPRLLVTDLQVEPARNSETPTLNMSATLVGLSVDEG